MLSTEEISIRLGVDSKAVGSGMASASSLIDKNLGGFKKKFSKFSGDILSGSVMGFFGSVTNSVTDLIKVGVDKLSDYISKTMYDTISGTSDRLIEATSRMHEESNAAGRKHSFVTNEMESMDIAEERRIFESKSAENRKKESEDAMFQTQAEMNLAKKKVKEATADVKEYSSLNKYNQSAMAEAVKKLADAEERVLIIRRKNIQAWKDLRQALKDTVSAGESTDGPIAGAFSFAQPAAALTGSAAVDNYMAKIKASQDAYKAKTDYSQFGKAIVEAQVEAAAEFVQKVSIVEIKE